MGWKDFTDVDPALVARLRWRIYFEAMWSDSIPQLVDTPMPRHLTGTERTEFYKNKRRAGELIKALFPPDED